MAAPSAPAGRLPTPERRGLATGLALVAATAYGGAAGLAGHRIRFGEPIDSRLPFRSYQLAGVALTLAVAVPMTVAAVEAWRGSPFADESVIVAGAALVTWIAVELVFIRSFSWLHPAYALVGLAVTGVGVHHRRADRRPDRRTGSRRGGG